MIPLQHLNLTFIFEKKKEFKMYVAKYCLNCMWINTGSSKISASSLDLSVLRVRIFPS